MNDDMPVPASENGSFEGFFGRVEPRLRSAFTVAYGPELGREAAAEALAWAFEHWPRVSRMEHPVGYLFRVGQSRTRRLRRRAPSWWATPDVVDRVREVDVRLSAALAALPVRQRVAVLLVHGHDWSHAEVAELLHVSASTVSTHVARGLGNLRTLLEVDAHERD